MRKTLLGLLFCVPLLGQNYYTVSKTTTLSSSAEIITVQQPATNALITRFVSARIDSVGACTFTIEINGTPASTTALTPAPVTTGEATATTTAYYSSNVGTGTVIFRGGVAANSWYPLIDLSHTTLSGNGTSKNLTLRTASCSGVVNITITYTESNY